MVESWGGIVTCNGRVTDEFSECSEDPSMKHYVQVELQATSDNLQISS
jgi:hypothetical protein